MRAVNVCGGVGMEEVLGRAGERRGRGDVGEGGKGVMEWIGGAAVEEETGCDVGMVCKWRCARCGGRGGDRRWEVVVGGGRMERGSVRGE